LPVPQLAPADQVARVGEGRDPAAVEQARIPADVIDVQVGAEHEVDRLRPDAGLRETFEEPAPVAAGKVRNEGPLLALTDAGIDQDRSARCMEHEGLDGEDQHAAFQIRVVGLYFYCVHGFPEPKSFPYNSARQIHPLRGGGPWNDVSGSGLMNCGLMPRSRPACCAGWWCAWNRSSARSPSGSVRPSSGPTPGTTSGGCCRTWVARTSSRSRTCTTGNGRDCRSSSARRTGTTARS